MKFSLLALVGIALGALAMVIVPTQSEAVLTLTPAGILDGFTLSIFATVDPGNTGCCGGPFGIAVASNGDIIVSNAGDSKRYVWHDVDGQTKLTAVTTAPSDSFVTAYATAGGKPYGAQGGHFVQFKNDGTVDHVLTGVTPPPFLGMWGNPVDGHIIATTTSVGLIDIDPLAGGGAGSFRVINGHFGDGVSVSPDGKTLFLEEGFHINGYDIASGAKVFDSGFIAGGPDGTGVITGGVFNGFIIVNKNDGEVDLLDPVTKALTAIATGGTRGDYASVDTNNGTIFLDFSDIVYRLGCGPGCSIGGPPTVPEPGTLSLFGIAFAALGAVRRRKGA